MRDDHISLEGGTAAATGYVCPVERRRRFLLRFYCFVAAQGVTAARRSGAAPNTQWLLAGLPPPFGK